MDHNASLGGLCDCAACIQEIRNTGEQTRVQELGRLRIQVVILHPELGDEIVMEMLVMVVVMVLVVRLVVMTPRIWC